MLNDVIIFEKRNVKNNENGFEEEVWHKEFTCWASKEKVVTTEDFSAGAYWVHIETTYKTRSTPHLEKLDPREYRVVYKGKPQDIKYIIEDGDKGEYMKIQSKMVS